MAMKRRAYSKRTGKRTKKSSKKITTKKSMVKLVKRVIKGASETKQVRYNASVAISAYNTSSWASGGLQLLMPVAGYTTSIGQGAGAGDRVSNKITTKSLWFNGLISPKVYDINVNPSPQPRDVMMVILSSKSDPTAVLAALPNLFQNGNTSQGPSGTQLDTIIPFNTDKYTIYYRRVFKCGTAENAGSGINNNYQRYSNNDYKICNRFRVNCTKYINKVLKFNDTSNVPNNRFLWAVFLVMNADGTSMGIGETQPLQLNCNWTYSYSDF